RTADGLAAALIVVGTHGRAGHHQQQVEGIQVILHPTDFSRASEAALNVARSLACDHGARLIVLHVVPRDIDLDGRMPVEIDTRNELHSLDVIRERVDGPDLVYPAETRLVRGVEADEILRAAQESLANLIVMGSHGRSRLGRLLMGSTSEGVVPKADCPVLVVKSPSSQAAPAPGPVATGVQALS